MSQNPTSGDFQCRVSCVRKIVDYQMDAPGIPFEVCSLVFIRFPSWHLTAQKDKDIVKIKGFGVGGGLLKCRAGTIDASKPLRGTRSGSVRGSAHTTGSGGLEGEQWVTTVKQPCLGSLFEFRHLCLDLCAPAAWKSG